MTKQQEILHGFRSIPKRLPLPFRMGYGWLKRKFIPHPIWDNEEFKRYYEWLQETQWWSRSQLEELQLDRLQALVKHAYENVPYYRRVFDERRLKPKDISMLGDLQKLPFLTKDDVRNNLEDLIARNIDPERLRYETTGGSTGLPLGFYHDKYTAHLQEAAFTSRQWNWAGYGFGDKIVTLRGNLITRPAGRGKRPWWDFNTDQNELVLSSSDMSEQNIIKYVEIIREFKPRFISAYPSSLEILARFTKKNKFGSIKPSVIFCESETLYPWQREFIESEFGCKIFAGYGHSERAADAVECEEHNGYHVSMEYGILELIGRNGERITNPGVLGRVVGTGFDTYCMPFIRYVTDDLAMFAKDTCKCKRECILIHDFKGRLQEFFVSKTGKLVPLTTIYAVHAPVWGKISELKFFQDQEGKLIVKIVKQPSSSEGEIERDFSKLLHECLQEDEFDIKIIFVDRVSRTQRGKLGLLEQKIPINFEDLDQTTDQTSKTVKSLVKQSS